MIRQRNVILILLGRAYCLTFHHIHDIYQPSTIILFPWPSFNLLTFQHPVDISNEIYTYTFYWPFISMHIYSSLTLRTSFQTCNYSTTIEENLIWILYYSVISKWWCFPFYLRLWRMTFQPIYLIYFMNNNSIFNSFNSFGACHSTERGHVKVFIDRRNCSVLMYDLWSSPAPSRYINLALQLYTSHTLTSLTELYLLV